MGAKYVFNPLTGNLDTTDVVAFNGEVNLGTAAAPSVFFTGDSNTGIYSPGADQLAISTNGTGRLFVDASGNVGVGTTSPGVALHVDGDIRCDGVYGETDTNTSIQFPGSDVITFNEGGSEAARIDSSGRLLVGTSSHSAIGGASGRIEVIGAINLRSTDSSVVDGDAVGVLRFIGDDSSVTQGAEIAAYGDGTWTGGTSAPTRLVFSVTADGASSTTEALRIKNSGIINIANTPVYADNAAAKTGGLVDGDVYRTSTGDLKIVYT